MITIDGSHGEGGGQVLRTALSLSAIRNQPFRMINIRAHRKKPGLMPQHLAATRAAQAVVNAQLSGDHTGSGEITFSPGSISGDSFRFDIGTAGSVSLVVQTVLPILLFAGGTSTFTVTGGTNVPFSPSADYLTEIFLPMLKTIGCSVRLRTDHYGFYPRGGGRVRAEVYRAGQLAPLKAMQRGRINRITGWSAVANLADSIAERQRRRAAELLRSMPCPVVLDCMRVEAFGPGSLVFLRLQAEHALAGFQSLGAPGKPAEVVATEAADELLDYAASEAALDPHLADQIVLYLAMCRQRSTFTTSAVTEHLLTNLWVLKQFNACTYSIEGIPGRPGRVIIN